MACDCVSSISPYPVFPLSLMEDMMCVWQSMRPGRDGYISQVEDLRSGWRLAEPDVGDAVIVDGDHRLDANHTSFDVQQAVGCDSDDFRERCTRCAPASRNLGQESVRSIDC